MSPDAQGGGVAFRRLVMVMNAGFSPILPSPVDAVALRKSAGFGRSRMAFVYDNGTTVLNLRNGEEVRVRSFDCDTLLLEHLSDT